MYDSRVGQPQKKDIDKIVNELWATLQLEIDFNLIEKIWDLVLEGNDIYIPYLVGWKQDERMPMFEVVPQSFEYFSQFYFEDASNVYNIVDLMNNGMKERDWKMKFRNSVLMSALVLSALASTWSSTAGAVPLLGETSGTIREGILTLYRDHEKSNRVYFFPNAKT